MPSPAVELAGRNIICWPSGVMIVRMLLRLIIPVEAGNKAVRDGSVAQTLQELGAQLKPEAAYFCSVDGKRAAYIVFDMQDAKSIPSIVEPLFAKLNAAVDFVPVMNLDDLKAGLSQVPR